MTIASPRAGRRAMRLAALACVVAFAAGWPAGGAQELLQRNYDTSLPIEITADSLEVQQEQQIAVFRGNVDAVQGEINLKADELTVHYRTGKSDANAVERIVADGNVRLISPTETARGEHGVYDVDADTVELTGSVVLTRGENVLTGSRLELNLATGMSRILGGAAAGVADGSGEQERVRAVFTPEREAGETAGPAAE